MRLPWSHYAQPLPETLTVTRSPAQTVTLSGFTQPCHCDYAAQNGRLLREAADLRDTIARLRTALQQAADDRDTARAEVRRLEEER